MTTTMQRELTTAFRSMASDVVLRVVRPGAGAPAALAAARAAVAEVATHLTRFDPTSALSRVNERPAAWHRVPAVLADAVLEAARAHRASDGAFDPRVLPALRAWGYDRTFADVLAGPVPVAVRPALVPRAGAPWRPVVLPGSGRRAISVGGTPVDLGGIGKGIAVRSAAARLAGHGAAVLVDAGGDLWLGGAGPEGDGWSVGVEDPHGGSDPVLVLRLADAACATSSVRRRRWLTTGGEVHHLVDPRTGRAGGAGLAAVTVVDRDPAWAEVWSKTLFLSGAAGIQREAADRGLAAAWVTDSGAVRTSDALRAHVVWEARR